MSGSVGLELRGGVAWLTLDRPEKLNAIDTPMVEALFARLDEVAGDDDVKVVVLRGAGRAFSAGYDLVEGGSAQRPAEDWHRELERDLELTLRLRTLPRPTIAAVHGWCLGGALDLAIACDMVVAADDARFGIPEIRYGSGPVTLLLPFVVGEKKANELVLTGADVDATEAERIGIVNRIVPRDALDDAVLELAARIVPTPLEVLRLTKLALIRAYDAMGLRTAQGSTLDLMAIVNASDSPEQRAFDRLVEEQGLRAALAERDRRYREGLEPPA